MPKAKCSLTIVLSFSEIKKSINKNVNEDIVYTVKSHQKNHTCIVKEKVSANPKDCLNYKELKKLAKNLVIQNIDKDYNFHIENFHKNNIFWNSKKIRKYVNNIIQDKYLKDEIFINNVITTSIILNKYEDNFCPSKIEYFDKDNNKYEKIICFTTNFQINVLKGVNMLFVDGTFKTSPRNFYQIINIIGYLSDKNLIIPNFTAAITSKTEKIYKYTLLEFQKLIDNLNIKIDFKKNKFMTDFEINLRSAIKKFYHSTI